jgi:PIN domain nuclease of toxin-antitoxin system
MNYLLDTYTLIWAVKERKKLSDVVTAILEDPDNAIFVSAVTFWEIALKYATGKLDLHNILPAEFPGVSIQIGFELLSLSPDEAASFNELMVTDHRDPFDRMLIWQAVKRNLIFISKDKSLEQYNSAGLKIIW